VSIETYITVHDSTLIRECEQSGKFDLVSHTYLFVGPRNLDIDPGIKVIVCKDIHPNYEHLPQFYDFTGWFVLAVSGMIEADNAIFLQYDHSIISSEIESKTEELLLNNSVVGYSPAGPELWTLALPNFYEHQVAGIRACGEDWEHLKANVPFEIWPTTQGLAWRTADFCNFMRWFEPAFDSFKEHVFAGHLAERMIQPYLMANNLTAGYLPGSVSHESLDCHGTKDLIMGNIDSYNQKVSTFGK
jgi:hypothetical protein